MGFSLNPLGPIFDLGKTIIERVVPDKAAQAEALSKLQEMQLSGDLAALTAQTDINKIEAASPHLFIAGWRPFIGWCCGCGLAIQFIVAPLFEWGSALCGHPTKMPALDMGTLMTLLLALLGMGSMRTVEKIQGAAKNH